MLLSIQTSISVFNSANCLIAPKHSAIELNSEIGLNGAAWISLISEIIHPSNPLNAINSRQTECKSNWRHSVYLIQIDWINASGWMVWIIEFKRNINDCWFAGFNQPAISQSALIFLVLLLVSWLGLFNCWFSWLSWFAVN